MVTNSRTLKVNIVGDARHLHRTFDSIERNTSKLSQGFGRLRTFAAAGVAAFAGAQVISKLGEFKDAASDLNETVSKTNVIFGRSAKEVQAWSKHSATSFGLSRQEALAAAASFGDMFLQLRLGRGPATDMSRKMVELAADFASFHNADISDVLEAQSAAFRGEFDSIQRFIPAINAARVQQEALALTHKKSAKDLTDADKAMAVYQIMLKDTTAAQGDFGRTADGAANQQRILDAQIKDLKATIGQALLPAYTAIVKKLNEEFIPAMKAWWKEHGPKVEAAIKKVGEFFTDLRGELGRVKKAWDDNADSFKDLLTTFANGHGQITSTKDAAEDVAGALEDITNAAGATSRALKTVGEWLDAAAEGATAAGRAMRIQYVIPTIEGFRKVVSASLIMGERVLAVSATMAEAMHLPQARALRKAQQDLREHRENFNREMKRYVDETVVITAMPRFQFSKSFTQSDWLAARASVGRAAKGMRVTAGTGPTADDVPIMVSRGETVVSAAHSARPEFRAWASSVGVPGFAAGGAILPRLRFGALPDQLGQFPGTRHGIANLMGNFTGRILDAALKKLFTGSAAIKAFIRSTDPLPYIWGGAGPGGYDCSGIVSAVLGKMTGRGGGHGQRYFTTASIRPGILGIKSGLGGTLQIGVTPSRGHMVGRYGGLGFEAESTRTGIKIGSAASRPEGFARHYHLARGGAITSRLKTFAELLALSGVEVGGDPGRLRIGSFDRGGWLMPGATLALNGTGRPERVGGGGFAWYGDINVYASGGDPGAIGGRVRAAVLEVFAERDRRARMGGRA